MRVTGEGLLGTVASLSLLSGTAGAQERNPANAPVWIEAPEEAVNLGQGFDLLRGLPTTAS